MASKFKFTSEQIERALRAANGVHALAARWLTENTEHECSPNTVRNYVRRHPRLKLVRDECRETLLDWAEGHLFAAVRQGSLKAVFYVLNRLGAERGYHPVQRLAGPDGGAIPIAMVPPLKPSDLAGLDQRALVALYDKLLRAS